MGMNTNRSPNMGIVIGQVQGLAAAVQIGSNGDDPFNPLIEGPFNHLRAIRVKGIHFQMSVRINPHGY